MFIFFRFLDSKTLGTSLPAFDTFCMPSHDHWGSQETKDYLDVEYGIVVRTVEVNAKTNVTVNASLNPSFSNNHHNHEWNNDGEPFLLNFDFANMNSIALKAMWKSCIYQEQPMPAVLPSKSCHQVLTKCQKIRAATNPTNKNMLGLLAHILCVLGRWSTFGCCNMCSGVAICATGLSQGQC